MGTALAITVALIGILASVPPVSRDALTHHLYVPKLYLKAGYIQELPHIPVSYYPQLLDLLYTIPLYFKNDILPKYIHFAFALATSFLIYSYLKTKFDRKAGLAGALFFLTIPVIVKLSITVYVDLGLIFFTFAAVIYLFKWKDSGLKWRYLVVSGIFTGLAIATKYNGILTLILLTLLLPFLMPEKEKKQFRSIFYPVGFALIALLVFSPWMIKNYVWTGNPLYPIYQMKVQSPEQSAEKQPNITPNDHNSTMNHFLVRKYLFQEKWWETLSIPLRIFFQGTDDNPALFDGQLNQFLLIMPLLFLILSRVKKQNIDGEIKFLLVFSVLYILLVFLKTDMRIRYVAPIIPPLVIASVAAMCKIEEYLRINIGDSDIIIKEFKSKEIVNQIFINIIMTLIFFLTISVNIIYVKALFLQYKPLEYISGKVSRSEYIKRFLPEYELIEYFNKNTHKEPKILAIFLGNRGYYFDHDVQFGTNPLFNAIKNSLTTKDISNQLKQDNFTHVIVGFDLLGKWFQDNLTQEEQIKIRDFFDNHMVLIKSNISYGLYQLK